MPSAAKRRKAAKKKKEKEAKLDISVNDSLGNEDVKSQDERGSDGGELISPSSLDHDNHQTPFNEVEKTDQPPVLRNAVEEDSTNAISAAGTDYSPGKIVSINYIELAKESKEGNDGSSSSSSSRSSSSSEDESRVTDSKSADHNLVLKTNACDNESDNSSAEVIQISNIAPVDEKINNPLGQIEVMGNSSLSGDSAADKTIYIAENKGAESFLLTPNDATKTSVASTNLTLEESRAKVEASTNLTLEESRAKVEEKEIENFPSSSVPISCTSNGTQQTKHYEIPEDSESQPLVAPAPAPAPRMAQRTSIFSCCGLFDALTGSNR